MEINNRSKSMKQANLNRWKPFTEKLRRMMEENPSLVVSFEGKVEPDCKVVDVCDPYTNEVICKDIIITLSPVNDQQNDNQDELEKELHELLTAGRSEIMNKIKEVRNNGKPLYENPEYDEAKAEQRTIEDRIDEIEALLAEAEKYS